MYKSLAILSVAALLTACSGGIETQTSDSVANQQQERIAKQSVQAVGLPAIVNFQEKRILKDILEMRDRPDLVTYTYITDLSGNLHKLCNSIGYGVPYATQYTSPQKLVPNNGFQSGAYAEVPVPQADPNGLFSPASADGTWVLCSVPGKAETKPVYVEARVVVAPFPLP